MLELRLCHENARSTLRGPGCTVVGAAVVGAAVVGAAVVATQHVSSFKIDRPCTTLHSYLQYPSGFQVPHLFAMFQVGLFAYTVSHVQPLLVIDAVATLSHSMQPIRARTTDQKAYELSEIISH